MTVVGETTDDDRVASEVVGSFDLFLTVPFGRGALETYVEASTTPRLNGVSRLVGEANADAGTALNRRRRGQVQLSEVRLVWPVAPDLRGHLGLLDATGFLDVSRIANDENLFFLGVPFVNNPTIEFPDYALGGAVQGSVSGTGRLRLSAVLVSSHGLADNPGVSYAQLLDLREPGKGLFGGVALRWVREDRRFSVGGWMRTSPVPTLDGSGDLERNRGLFSVAGITKGRHSVSLRGGISNGHVSLVRGFTGATYLWARRPTAVGLAVGRSFSAGQLGLDDIVHGEAFLRRRLLGDAYVTLSLQRIHNSGFDGSGVTVPPELWVGGVRLSAQF